MAAKIYAGTVGLLIDVDLGETITGATGKFFVKKPRGSIVTWDAVVADTTHLQYETVEGDLNLAGTYEIQPYVAVNDYAGRANTVKMEVHEAFD